MELEAIVTSLESVPESLREFYSPIEGDASGRHLLKVSAVDGFALEDVAGLKTALGKEKSALKELRGEGAKLQEQLTELRATNESLEAGIKTPEEMNALLEKKFGGQLKDLAKKNQEEKDALVEKLQGKDGAISRLVLETAASKAISESGIVDAHADFMRNRLMAEMRVHQEDEDSLPTAVLVDAEGTPRVGANADHMTVKERIEEMKKDKAFAMAFVSNVKPGGGTPPVQQRPGGVHQDPSKIPSREKIRAGLEALDAG
jgi:hypothetical protein